MELPAGPLIMHFGCKASERPFDALVMIELDGSRPRRVDGERATLQSCSGYDLGNCSAEGSELGSIVIRLVALCALICLTACDRDERRQGDIYLPAGDPAKGEMHFVSLGCIGCHSVIGAELPEPVKAGPVRVLLGSRTGRSMSYGQLVTAIVNPSHRLSPRYRKEEVSRDGESLMAYYNDVLTVTQLTDLVAFLQAHYQKADRPGYKYRDYTQESEDDSEGADSQ